MIEMYCFCIYKRQEMKNNSPDRGYDGPVIICTQLLPNDLNMMESHGSLPKCGSFEYFVLAKMGTEP